MTRYEHGYEEKVGRYKGCDIYCVNDGDVPRLEIRKASIWSKLVAAVRGWHVHQHFTNPRLDMKGPTLLTRDDFVNGRSAKLEAGGNFYIKEPIDFSIPDKPEKSGGVVTSGTLSAPTDAQRKNEKLAALARYRDSVRDLIDKKKAQKKRWSHLEAARKAALNEALEIETGKLVYQGGLWVPVEDTP